MDPETYWKFCTLLGRLDSAIQRALAAKAQLFTEHGLDPSKNYETRDDTCEIREVTADGG